IRVNGRHAPILALCRALIEAGHDPATPLEVSRGSTLCLRVRSIGEGAKLTIDENQSCRFALFRPFQDRAPQSGGSPPVAPNREALPEKPPGENNAPCETRAAVPMEATHG